MKILADKFNINFNAGLSEAEESVYEAFRALIEDRLIPMLALERFAFFKWDDYKVPIYHLHIWHIGTIYIYYL